MWSRGCKLGWFIHNLCLILSAYTGRPTRSMVLASGFLSLEHHVSHHSQSCGSDLMGTMWIILFGRSWGGGGGGGVI